MLRLKPTNKLTPTSFIRTLSMSSHTFTIKANKFNVPVEIPSHINMTESQLTQFLPFKRWINNLNTQDMTGYQFHKIDIQSVDWFGNGRLGFVKLYASVVHPTGKNLPGVIFLRGGSVAMFIQLQAKETGDLYVILVSQPRIASGDLQFYELPAGMIDDGSFRGAAAKEIQEECGFTIPENDLKQLSKEPVYTSPGALDECMSFYSYTKTMPLAEIQALDGKLTGNPNESEPITLNIVPQSELKDNYQRDAKILIALSLL